MKNLFKNKAISGLVMAAVVLGGLSFYAITKANPDAIVTPATGAAAVSIDTTSNGGNNTWTTITGLTITEGNAGDIALGPHVLTLPTGWEFDTSQMLVVGTEGKGLTLSSANIFPQSQTISFNVIFVSSEADKLIFPGIKVRPTGTAPGTGNITMTTGVIAGVDGGTNFAALTSVSGAVTKLAITTQPIDTVYGSTISAIEVKTQDQFGNDSTNGLGGTENVTITKASGAGALSGTTVQDIGTSGGNGSVSFDTLKLSDVGAHTVEVQSASYAAATSDSFTITQKPLTATITVDNKVYDGDASAVISEVTPVGVEAGDTVVLSGGTATFDGKAVGTDKAVNATGILLGGAHSAKYSFDGTATGNADITPLEVTIDPDSEFTANNKVYDREVTATILTNNLTLAGTIDGDMVSISPVLAFADATVGDGKTVSITGGTFGGDDGGNYSLSVVGAPTATANITPKELEIGDGFTPASKPYDGTTAAGIQSNDLNITGFIPEDDASWEFDDSSRFDTEDVGTGKTVTAHIVLTGADKDNYSLPADGAITSEEGVITAKELTVAGTFTADSKSYDGNTAAVIDDNSLVLTGVVDEEDVSLVPVLVFADKMAGEGKTVGLAGSSLDGADAGNYSLSLAGAPTTTADIDKVAITLAAQSNSKVYDGNTNSAVAPSVTVGAFVGGDTGTYSQVYDTEDVGANKTLTPSVVSIKDVSEADMSSNYAVTLVNDTTGVIEAKQLTVIHAVVTEKVYDGTNAATITGAELDGVVDGDDVTLENHTLGTFADKHAGTDKSVTTAPMTITGDDSSNYTLSQPVLGGTIVVRPITVTAQTDTKAYNENNTSSVSPVGDDLQAGDSYTTPGTQTFDSPAIGAGKTITASGTVIDDGNGGRDYQITYVTALGAITAGALDHFTVTSSTATPNSGTPFSVTITAVDEYGNAISAVNGVAPYSGVAFISTNATAPYTLPSSYAYIPGNEGTKTFTNGVIFNAVENGVSISVRDSGNAAVVGGVTGLNVSTDADTTAPEISGVEADSTKTTTAVTFASSENGFAKVAYSYGSLTPIETSYVAITAATPATINLGNLVCGTTYSYTVYAKDAGNNEAGSSSTFETAACDAVVLGVTNNQLVKRYATKDGDPANGWHWILDVTVPTDETSMKIKFSDLAGAGTIAAGNIHFFSEQSSNFNSAGSMASIAAANEWSDDVLLLDDDIDGNPANGRQIQIKIQAGVPADATDGSYSASYDVDAYEPL